MSDLREWSQLGGSYGNNASVICHPGGRQLGAGNNTDLNDFLSGIGTYVHYLLTKITCYYYYYIWPNFIIIIINIAYELPDVMSVFLKFNTMNLLLKILAFGREIHRSPLNFPHKGPVARRLMFLDIGSQVIWDYRHVPNIRRTKSQHLKDSRIVLRLSLPNPLKPDVKSRMKM